VGTAQGPRSRRQRRCTRPAYFYGKGWGSLGTECTRANRLGTWAAGDPKATSAATTTSPRSCAACSPQYCTRSHRLPRTILLSASPLLSQILLFRLDVSLEPSCQGDRVRGGDACTVASREEGVQRRYRSVAMGASAVYSDTRSSGGASVSVCHARHVPHGRRPRCCARVPFPSTTCIHTTGSASHSGI
jgi:hypothetical protein